MVGQVDYFEDLLDLQDLDFVSLFQEVNYLDLDQDLDQGQGQGQGQDFVDFEQVNQGQDFGQDLDLGFVSLYQVQKDLDQYQESFSQKQEDLCFDQDFVNLCLVKQDQDFVHSSQVYVIDFNCSRCFNCFDYFFIAIMEFLIDLYQQV